MLKQPLKSYKSTYQVMFFSDNSDMIKGHNCVKQVDGYLPLNYEFTLPYFEINIFIIDRYKNKKMSLFSNDHDTEYYRTMREQ